MKKLTAIILFALCSIAFSQTCDTPSLTVSDSASYYKEMALQLKSEGDSLEALSEENIGSGILSGALGAVGLIWSINASGGSSLEGGGVAVALIMIPSAYLLLGGVMGLAAGAGQNARAYQKLKQSEEYQNKAYRENKQQVKVDFLPIIDPLSKTVGMDLALGF
jgi:hypothetical protein